MTNDSNPANATKPPATPAELDRTVNEISRTIGELRCAQSAMRTQLLLGTLVIVAMMLVFGGVTYFKIRDNLTQDKLRDSAMVRAKLLMPELQTQITASLHDVLPFYLKMGRERFAAVSPKLQSRLKDEADKLGPQIQERLGAQVDLCFKDMGDRATAQLTQAFPAIADDGGRHATERLQQAMTGEGQKLHDHLMTLCDAQTKRLRQVINEFPLPDVTKTDTDALQRVLLHNLIMLADYEVLAPASPPSLDTKVMTQAISMNH